VTAPRTPTLQPGAPLPPFRLLATDGQRYSPEMFADHELLVIVFLANHCPYVAAWEDRLLALAHEFGPRGVAMAAISASDSGKYPQDGPDGMAQRAREKQYPFPYLHDGDQGVARAFGATRTPEVFVFDRDRVLQYHGAIDSDFDEGEDREEYLRDALAALLAGRPIPRPETEPLGCRIELR
jgi:peroxiredoxin